MGITNTISKLKAYFDTWHNKDVHLDLIYPVGSIYMTVEDINPAEKFGGTWKKIEGRFLLGSGTTTDDTKQIHQYFNTDTGGRTDAIVVKHNHTQETHNHEQDHTHRPWNNTGVFLAGYDGFKCRTTVTRATTKQDNAGVYYIIGTGDDLNMHCHTVTGSTTVGNVDVTPEIHNYGFSGENKNMPPYLVVNIWKRTG